MTAPVTWSLRHRPGSGAARRGDEAHVVGAAVVFDDFALALDEFLGRRPRVALLAEEGALAGLGRDHADW
jgi:hypothetical protein